MAEEAPKAEESFDDLFTRASTFKRHDQQFNTSSANRSGTGQKGKRTPRRDASESQVKPLPVGGSRENTPKKPSDLNKPMRRRGGCYSCGERGHIARFCTNLNEAPGRSNSKVSMLTT